MNDKSSEGEGSGEGNLLVIALLTPIVGAAAGFICAIFRLLLEHADRLRNTA